mgnify:CR=1 FL=1
MLFKVLLAGMCSLCLVGTATLASAHEFIVKPDKTQAAKGESVGVQAQAAHVFMISEEAEPVETVVVFTNPSASLNLPRSTGHYTEKTFLAYLKGPHFREDKKVEVEPVAAALRQQG